MSRNALPDLSDVNVRRVVILLEHDVYDYHVDEYRASAHAALEDAAAVILAEADEHGADWDVDAPEEAHRLTLRVAVRSIKEGRPAFLSPSEKLSVGRWAEAGLNG